ncbi:MAG: LysR family transcriptional regulator [Thermoplasmata archaeon]|nr:LysR family transcriptional regulator [Thermoplasmata archaeon]
MPKKKGGIGHLVPDIILVSDRGQITLRQLEILRAVSQERSQNMAAARLNISTAVLNKQLKDLERKANAHLVSSTKRGSQLTQEGKQLLRILDAMCKRITRAHELTIGCTPVSQAIVERASSRLAQKGIRTRLVVSDDDTNISMSASGMTDIIFLDDPQFAYDFPKENRVHEVTKDFLLHCERGKNYARLNSGPQRIGYEMLDQDGTEYYIRANYSSPEEIVSSKFSFFISKILLTSRRLELPSNAKLVRIPYAIYAVETTEHAHIRDFFECMSPAQFYPIG